MLEHRREDLVDVGLLAADNATIRQGNADRRHCRASPGDVGQCGGKSNSVGHFRGFLALATFPSDLSMSASQQPVVGDLGAVQLLTHMDLTG